MKIISVFSKAPKHKRFNYSPRFYDAQEEERREREERIRRELDNERLKNGVGQGDGTATDLTAEPSVPAGYRDRISGSFRMAKKTAKVQADPSANMLRLVILLILSLGLIAFIQFGLIALYIVAFLFVPFYFYLKFRKPGS